MPLFITDEELESLRSNVTFIVSKADSFITSLQRQLETIKSQAEASSITAEQKYISLSSDFEKLESKNAELNAAIKKNLEELAVVKSEKNRIHLESIEKDGTIERLWAEASEIHKSKRQLLGIIEQKDTEIMEKNSTIKSYLDRIVNLTEAAALKQSQLHEREAEFARSQATCARLSQTHLAQVENDYREKLEKEVSARLLLEKAAADLKEKLNKCDIEIENHRKANELSLLQISSFERWTDRGGADNGLLDGDHMIVPKIPVGVSGTALAASLLHDGWSLAKMYEKFQEAVDALRHESMGRKQSQAILERRLRELAQKASADKDHLETMVEEKKIEVDSCRKTIEILGVEKGNLENRIAELLGMYKNIDLEDYSRMKEDFHQMQVKLKTVEAELDECKELLSEKQDSITSLELQLERTRVELTEQETRIKESLQTEATLKLELEKQRRLTTQYKRMFDNLTKEKEEWTKEKQTLVRQEESRQGKRPLGDTSSEQAMKEKEARIQILERTIEREREEHRKEKEEHRNEKEELLKEKEEHHKEKEKHLKEKEEHRKEKVEHQKEKALLLKNQEIYEAFLKRANQERDKLVQEIERHNKQLSDYGFTSGGSSGDAQTVEPTEIGCVCSRHSTCGTVNCVCCSKKLPCTPSCSCKRERCTRRFSLHSL